MVLEDRDNMISEAKNALLDLVVGWLDDFPNLTNTERAYLLVHHVNNALEGQIRSDDTDRDN